MNSLSSDNNNIKPNSKNGKSPGPLDVISNDKGAQTIERFGYQFAYTALLAIQLRSGDSKYRGQFCSNNA